MATAKPKGANGFFSAPGMTPSSRWFVVSRVAYGIDVNASEQQTARYKTVYFRRSYHTNFAVGLIFNGWTAYQTGMNWFLSYGNAFSNPDVGATPPMTFLITMPTEFGHGRTISYSGVGVPSTGMAFGDKVGEFLYTPTISFVGATNPNSVSSLNDTSSILRPGHWGTPAMHTWTKQAPFFYPLGTQPGSTVQLGTPTSIYNSPPPSKAPVVLNPHMRPLQ